MKKSEEKVAEVTERGEADSAANGRAASEPIYDPTARPVWELVVEIGAHVPPEEWAKVPADFARHAKHYLYGAPKE
jgi:hypothetical protein